MALLNEAEKKAREDARSKKAEEEKKANDDLRAKEEEALKALDDLGKIQFRVDKVQGAVEKEIAGKLTVRRLTKAQKAALFKTIRYSHLSHEDLLETGKHPLFADDATKDLIMQGLSYRLAPYEKSAKEKEYTINLKARPSYRDPTPPKAEEPKEPTPREKDAATSPTSGPGKFVNPLYKGSFGGQEGIEESKEIEQDGAKGMMLQQDEPIDD